MTRRKAPRLFSISPNEIANNPERVFNQIQSQVASVSSDLADIMDNGVTLTDNMAAEVRDYRFVTGVWTELALPRGKFALGAQVLYTSGAEVTSMATEYTAAGSLRMKLVLEPSPSTIKVIVYARQ